MEPLAMFGIPRSGQGGWLNENTEHKSQLPAAPGPRLRLARLGIIWPGVIRLTQVTPADVVVDVTRKCVEGNAPAAAQPRDSPPTGPQAVFLFSPCFSRRG